MELEKELEQIEHGNPGSRVIGTLGRNFEGANLHVAVLFVTPFSEQLDRVVGSWSPLALCW